MIIYEVILDLKPKQGDVTAVFLHSKLPEGENIYVAMPRRFIYKGKVLKLWKTLYWLSQSPRAFWRYLKDNLDKYKLKHIAFDPCIIIGDKVIWIVYVDDLLFWTKYEAYIIQVVLRLRNEGVNLEQEYDAAGFLGVKLDLDAENGLIEMCQDGLIYRVIS